MIRRLISNTLRRRRSDQRGAVIVLVAAALPAFVLFAAFVIDVGHWYDWSRNLQLRADAAALAGGDQYGAICAGSPSSDMLTGPMAPIGKVTQLFSGPPNASSDLYYPYTGNGSPPAAFPQLLNPAAGTSGYWNIPNLSAGSPANYHVLLNSTNYWDGSAPATSGTQSFTMGTFCNATDPSDGTSGPMVDVKLTQDHLPLFFPLFNLKPTITAHARVSLQSVGTETNLLPIAVRDAGATPCLAVNLLDSSGSKVQTIPLQFDKTATAKAGGPEVWDNYISPSVGTPVSVPTAGLSAQYMTYAEDASGHCTPNSPVNPLYYEGTNPASGLVFINGYASSSPAPGQTDAPRIVGVNSNGDGVTLTQSGSCSADSYFSTSAGCQVSLCAYIAFTQGATAPGVTATDSQAPKKTITLTQGATTNCPTHGGITPWTSPAISIPQYSGQHQFDLSWSETSTTYCPTVNKKTTCSGDFNVQQQAFAGCDASNAALTCNGNWDSGSILLAEVGEGVSQTVGSFQAGSHTLEFTVYLQGLSDAKPGDPPTLLKFKTGTASTQPTGIIDCGQGTGGSFDKQTIIYGCPVVNSAKCTDTLYCAPLFKSPDGTCNNTIRNAPATSTAAVDCVQVANNGNLASVPSCVAAVIVGFNPKGNLCNPPNGPTICAPDHWLLQDGIPEGDPRAFTMIISYAGDLSSPKVQVPIRNFATFYVTGWSLQGNSPNCGTFDSQTNPGGNETYKGASAGEIWGHWITYTDLGASGNGQACDPNAFGNCAPVLTR